MHIALLQDDLSDTTKSLEAMLAYMSTVKRVAEDLEMLTSYFDASSPIGRRVRDLLLEMAENTDVIADMANKAPSLSA
ncbi:hypothetical protein [Pseudogemmobacter humi]|uniref:Uncharacterized protein n=1 Tax=Pseudogemmobacter humi TaxID=2483812 RepID=A0A3P5WEJ1_9RHOB|nr:hypothetical protein [Pseudogemmobacter humi]VDC18934.1 hypothetical protein XINFAN_00021 [Pseudogemmobacter humi]